MAPEILTEYRDTGTEPTVHFPEVELEPWLELLTVKSILVEAPSPSPASSARDSMTLSQCSKRLRIACFKAPQLYWAMWVWSLCRKNSESFARC